MHLVAGRSDIGDSIRQLRLRHRQRNYVARPYLESGQLMQVLTDWTAEQFPISVMYPRSRHLSAKVRIFVDWVSELIQQEPFFQAR